MKLTQAAYIIGSLGGRPIKYPKNYRGGGYNPVVSITFDSLTITFDSTTITFDHQ